MSAAQTVQQEDAPEGMSGLLGAVERIGNKVPHPVLMFLYLIAFIIVISTVLDWANVSVTETIAEPVPANVQKNFYEDTTAPLLEPEQTVYDDPKWDIHEVTIPIQALISVDGIRFIFSSFVSNFQGFGVVAVTFIALLGAGAAEGAGLMDALIRKLVNTAPAGLITFLIVLVGALSSVASDAGYLILIPLAAVAFYSIGRHPLAGMAAGFAGVAAIFPVNIIPQPTDAMLTEVANEAIGLVGGQPMSILNGYYFGVVSMLVLCVVGTIVTERIVEPRLGPWNPATKPEEDETADARTVDPAAEARGLRFAGLGVLGVIVFVAAITAPSGAPLRDPQTGAILGTTPFMDSLLFIITLCFLIAGIAYGIGAGTVKSADDVIASITKTFNGLGGMVFMLLMIAQFIAFFNYTNLPDVIGVKLADWLERADLGATFLLVGFMIVIFMLDFIIPGAIPKWAIFAPVFVPVFYRLGVAPQSLLAAYRVGDAPVNTLTPLMVYFPFIVTIAKRYDRKSGIGSVIALMLPYALIMGIIWVVLFVIWFKLGIPLGPGYSVDL